MQLIDRKHIEKRILYYWSKMYTKSIKAGQDYNKLQKAIVILISDYNLENLKEIKKYITNWKIREEDNPKCILTDMLTFYIIELDKYKKYVKNNKNIKLNSWIEFIQNPNEVNCMSNKEIKKAKEVLEEISQDERERRRLLEIRSQLRPRYWRVFPVDEQTVGAGITVVWLPDGGGQQRP